MYSAEHIESVYRLANTVTILVKSLYTEGRYSSMYKDLFRSNPVELKSMKSYFPFIPHTDLDFSAFEFMRNVLLFHGDHGSKITTVQEIYGNGTGYPSDHRALLDLVDLGLVKLAQIDKLQRPDEVYIHILDTDTFLQAYKTALIKYQLSCEDYKDYDYSTVNLASRISDYMSYLSYTHRDQYMEKLTFCIDRINTYWSSRSNKYLGSNDTELFFPFMVESEKRLLLMAQYKTKTAKKNKEIDYTFSLRDLDLHKDVGEKHRAILALVQMGFLTCVNRVNGEKWYFDVDNKFRVIDTSAMTKVIYPTWMTKYMCTITSHLDKFTK